MIEELGMICGNNAATDEWCHGGPNINAKRCTKVRQMQSRRTLSMKT